MYEKKIPVSLKCGLHLFKEVLSGKWKTMLLYFIYIGHHRPGELQRMIPDADRRVLERHLKELTEDGLLIKKSTTTFPLKVEYELTSLGKTLEPVVRLMDQWGEEHRKELLCLIEARR